MALNLLMLRKTHETLHEEKSESALLGEKIKFSTFARRGKEPIPLPSHERVGFWHVHNFNNLKVRKILWKIL